MSAEAAKALEAVKQSASDLLASCDRTQEAVDGLGEALDKAHRGMLFAACAVWFAAGFAAGAFAVFLIIIRSIK